MVDDEGISKILSGPEDLEQMAKQLVDAANASGGRDNISVVLVRASEGRTKKGLMVRLLGK